MAHIGDGRRFLYDSKARYNFIFSDVYSSIFSIPPQFTTREFFQLIKEKLTPHGVFAANIIGKTERDPRSLLFSEIRTAQSVFPDLAVIAVHSRTDPKTQNFIFVARKDGRPLTARAFMAQLPHTGILHTLPQRLLDLSQLPLQQHPLLTDNYAPVAYLSANLAPRYIKGP